MVTGASIDKHDRMLFYCLHSGFKPQAINFLDPQSWVCFQTFKCEALRKLTLVDNSDICLVRAVKGQHASPDGNFLQNNTQLKEEEKKNNPLKFIINSLHQINKKINHVHSRVWKNKSNILLKYKLRTFDSDHN